LFFGCGNPTGGGGGGGGTATYTLCISITPEGWGTGEVSPTGEVTLQGIKYDAGTIVTVTTEGTSGHIFDHWGGDLSGSTETATITMDADKNIIASFQHIYYHLGVSVTPEGSGTIEPWGGDYIDSTIVLLTAEAATNYVFSSWEGDAFGTFETTTVEMNSNKEVKAYFEIKHAIGDSYGGGIIFYIDGTGQHGYIAATSDQSTGTQWRNGINVTTNATGAAVDTGQTNTTTIISVQGDTGSYAAKICNDYVTVECGVPYDDWFLPSKDELNLLYAQKNEVGGFAYLSYWSSTEYNFDNAWYQYFGDGNQSYHNKAVSCSVRAVRAF